MVMVGGWSAGVLKCARGCLRWRDAAAWLQDVQASCGPWPDGGCCGRATGVTGGGDQASPSHTVLRWAGANERRLVGAWGAWAQGTVATRVWRGWEGCDTWPLRGQRWL